MYWMPPGSCELQEVGREACFEGFMTYSAPRERPEGVVVKKSSLFPSSPLCENMI